MRENAILFRGNGIVSSGSQKVMRGNEMHFVGTKSVYIYIYIYIYYGVRTGSLINIYILYINNYI